jgi:hypothetical protein
MIRKIRRVFCFVLASFMILGTSNVALAAKVTSVQANSSELTAAYETLMNYAKLKGIDLDLELDTFIQEYEESSYTNTSEYLNAYYQVFQKPTLTLPGNTGSIKSSGDIVKWYYDTGTTLPQAADYSKYNLLNTVQKGDIIFEAKAGFGITGHVAIVEGIFYSETMEQYYIRVVEATLLGVIRSVLDDSRVNDNGVSVLRVSGTTSSQIDHAVDFCISQLGKGYSLDFAKDTSASESNWYCSELVWAGYYNNGINIETTGFYNEPGITPRDIKNSSMITNISFQ